MVPPRRPGFNQLLKTGGLSLIIHVAITIFLSLNPWLTITKVQPMAYTVTLMPVPITEPEIPKPPPPPPPAPKEEKIKPIEKVKPIEKTKTVEKPKKDDIIEKVKKKEKDEESLKHLQQALEEIRKKIALDEIQKRVAQKERSHKEREEDQPAPPTPTPPTPAPPIPTPPTPTPPNPTSPPVSSSKPSPELLTIYSSIIKAKILQEWTIPENLLKEMVDLETVIVVIIERDGRIQRPRYDKKSGNTIYDQSAMRAIKKAEPFPPIPKELGENSLEYEMHFTPDLIR
jgi:TonB family protein